MCGRRKWTARNLVERFIVLPAIKAIVTIDTMAFGFFYRDMSVNCFEI